MENVTSIKQGRSSERSGASLGPFKRLGSRNTRDAIARLGHEIRSPLGTIIGFTEILLARAESMTSDRGWLRNIHHSANGLLTTLEDLLDLTALETGVLELRPTRLTVARVIEDVCNSMLALWGERGVVAKVDCPEALEIEADGDRVRQILRHLLDNAGRFSPDRGTIAVNVKEVVLIEPGGEPYVRIDVVDRGIGIDPLEWDQIFVEFERGSNARNTEMDGLGLGLALVRRLVELHGGTVWVESEPGRGSRFSVVMPSSFRGANCDRP